MSLTVGTGPFGQRPAGRFNQELPELRGLIYFEDSPRRIRARFGGETVVDSHHPKLLHEHGHLPVYYFPAHDVRTDLLEPSDRSTHCPFKGDATYWSVRVGETVAKDAVWAYLDPLEGAPPLADYRALYWDAMDEWLEEDEPAVVHARDPYHRVDVLDTSREVEVRIGGEVVARTRRARVLFETGLPPRWYIPPEDVRFDLLRPTDTRTGCAYKGFASYWSAHAGGAEEVDVAWTYLQPRQDAARVAGYVAFFDERVDLVLDGEPQERPVTQWSPRG